MILWAGDCMHAEKTDIARLPGYDVYLCAGWQQNLQENLAELSENQTLCIIDINNEIQMSLFHHVYDGCFAEIDSDYNGNTPTLPLADYSRLLQEGGVARNIEGINSMVIPYENFYGMLELFAPVLPKEILEQRRWCSSIIELSKRDDLSPIMVWTSHDLNHPYYAYVKEHQTKFEKDQQKRNAAWPQYEPTLIEQWEKVSPNLLLCPIYQHLPSGKEALNSIMPHLSRFDEFLSNRIESLASINQDNCLLVDVDYKNEANKFNDDMLSMVGMKQTVLRLLGKSLPQGLRGKICTYRQNSYPMLNFGLMIIKGGPAPV